MKKTISILLILVIALQTGSRVWIQASFYINRDYIASEICINRFDAIPTCKGSCYLEKQLNDDAKKQQTLPDLKVKEVTLFQPTTVALQLPVTNLNYKKNYPLYNHSRMLSGFYTSLLRPPCFA